MNGKKVHIKSPLPPTSPSVRGAGGVKKALILSSALLILFVSSCKTKEVPGRRRAPRHCNSCTKWSYVPQEAIDTLTFQCMSYQPTKEEAYLCTERFGMTDYQH